MSIVSVAYNFFLLAYGQTTGVAAFSVIMYVDSFIGMLNFGMCFSSYFTAIERPARSLAVSFFGTLVFPIGCLFILTPIWQLDGVWISAFFSCTASAVMTVILALTLKPRHSDFTGLA